MKKLLIILLLLTACEVEETCDNCTYIPGHRTSTVKQTERQTTTLADSLIINKTIEDGNN
jgi:hypothetical protein